MLTIPQDVQKILEELQKAGYEAFCVGGCVRDMLMGKTPNDYDICTNALPEKTMEIFAGQRVIPTGIKHGTVTVIMDNVGYEITTYRIDGDYSDGRHPDKVSFTPSLKEDLARRDFTVNALAYSKTTGVVDCFGGVDDINRGIIRCVGKGEERFSEDALRIMRAVRFASVLGFEIEEKTAIAIKKLYKRLDCVASERINTELCKMLLGKACSRYIKEYDYIFLHIIPEFLKINQKKAVIDAEAFDYLTKAELSNRLAIIFFGLADKEDMSQPFVKRAMKRLRFDSETINETVTLISFCHKDIEDTRIFTRKMLRQMEKSTFEKLLDLKRALLLSEKKSHSSGLLAIERQMEILKDFDVERECCSLKQLAVKGDDLVKIGVKPGRELGNILDRLLTAVIEEAVENDRKSLIEYAKNDILRNKM